MLSQGQAKLVKINSNILILMSGFEELLKKSAVYENDLIVEFENENCEINEEFDDLRDEIVELLQPHIVHFASGSLDINDLPEFVLSNSLEDLAKTLNAKKEEFPFFSEWTRAESQWEVLIYWDPLDCAIRSYFNVEIVNKIANRHGFALALRAYAQMSEDQNIQWLQRFSSSALAVLGALKKSKFAKPSDIEIIDSAETMFTPQSSDVLFHPGPIIFQNSSANLESPFLKWIKRSRGLMDMFGDEFLEDETDEFINPNWESLRYTWLNRKECEASNWENHYWILVAADEKTEFEDSQDGMGMDLHLIYQLFRQEKSSDIFQSEFTWVPTEKYKLALLRTGVRTEYNSTKDIKLLAAQVVLFAKNQNLNLSQISSEIDWLRLNQRDFPFEGLLEEELLAMSRN